jgi:hypothetical protein
MPRVVSELGGAKLGATHVWASLLSLVDFRYEGSCPRFIQRAGPEMKTSLI